MQHLLERSRIGVSHTHRRRRHILNIHELGLHVLRKCNDDRTGAPGSRCLHGVGDRFGYARGVVDLRDPLRERAEHRSIIDFLECAAIGVAARNLTDEDKKRRAVLLRHVHADGAVTRARPAAHHRRGDAAGELSVGFGHVHRAGLDAAGDHVDAIA